MTLTTMTRKVGLTDLAIAHGLSYQSAHARATKGEFGPVVREGDRIFVLVNDEPAPKSTPSA